MCDEAVSMEPWSLEFVPDHLKREDVCREALSREPYALRLVPDWFVVLQEMWCFDDNDYFISWHNAYKKARLRRPR